MFDIKITFEDYVRGIVPVSLTELVFLGWWRVYLCTPLCYFVVVMHLFSKSLSIVLWFGGQLLCRLQLLERQVYSVSRLSLDQSFLSLCHRRHVAGLCMLCKVNSNSNHCLFSELSSASIGVRPTRARQTWAAAAAHPYQYEVSRWRTYKFVICFLPAQVRIWNDLPTRCLTLERWMGSGVQSTVGCFPVLYFLSFPRCRCLWGFESNLKAIVSSSLWPVLLVLIIRIIIIIYHVILE